MNELLKAYINSGVRIPLKQLKLLTRADIKSYLRRRYFTFRDEDFGFDNALDIHQVNDSQAVIAYEYDLFNEYWIEDADLIKKAIEIDGTNIHYIGINNVDMDTLLISIKSRPRVINDLSEKQINDVILYAVKKDPNNIRYLYNTKSVSKHITKEHVEKALYWSKKYSNNEIDHFMIEKLLEKLTNENTNY